MKNAILVQVVAVQLFVAHFTALSPSLPVSLSLVPCVARGV